MHIFAEYVLQKSIHTILKEVWGYEAFRPLQEEIIQSVLDGNDTLALLPTGGGKSLCFQVPAMALEGICIVVSPLIALMKDQVEQLERRGINALYLHSGLGKREIDIALDNCVYGNVKFLYISPERLQADLFVERFKKMKVCFIAIDEAHCISEWGHDFRPSYLEIAALRAIREDLPFMALTASATGQVQNDISQKLLFRNDFKIFRKSFDRSNLVYAVSKTEDKHGRMLYALQKTPGSAIIYVRNRRQTKELSDWLNAKGVNTTYYHAGLANKDRNRRQELWIANKLRVIVATNAFGMGIDKPDVRLVMHYGLPDNLEAYYQEAGRAGRDGQKAFALSFLAANDFERLDAQLIMQFPEPKQTILTYHALGNFFQVPVGMGQDSVHDFDLTEFCKIYELKPLEVMAHFKVLEQSGYLLMNAALKERSRLKIRMRYEDIYGFIISNKRFESMLKALMRLYGGLFENYVKIVESKLASLMRVPLQEIQKLLKELASLDVIDYHPTSGKPQIVYLTHRHDKSTVRIDREWLEERKQIAKGKLEAIKDYGTTSGCRGNVLLDYFDEAPKEDCGHCDYCLKPKQDTRTLAEQILNSIPKDGIPLDTLKMDYSAKAGAFSETLRTLLNEELLELRDNVLFKL